MGSNLANGHYHLLFNFSLNVCHLADDAKASILSSIVRSLWEAHTNAPFECPFQPVSIKSFHNFIDFSKNTFTCGSMIVNAVFVAALFLVMFIYL